MTRDEWLAAALKDAPPLGDAQLAALRPIGQHMSRHMGTAPAVEQEPQPGVTETERNTA